MLEAVTKDRMIRQVNIYDDYFMEGSVMLFSCLGQECVGVRAVQ